ncbi:BTB domain-containing protein [Pseudomonas sp. IT-347P]|uniref:hypothetical protein n=1 Tax=Pseudomonas sp. IT-347P TaxID=3026458 RepID=UPI0039DF52A4
MTGKRIVTPGTTGEFNAKIQGHPDLAVNSINVSFSGGNLHISAREGDFFNFRSLYLIFKLDESNKTLTFDRLLYIGESETTSGFAKLRSELTTAKTFNIDFDVEKGTYKGSFNGVIPTEVGGERDILCSFDLLSTP